MNANQLVPLPLLASSDSLQSAYLCICKPTELKSRLPREKYFSVLQNSFPRFRLRRIVRGEQKVQSSRVTLCRQPRPLAQGVQAHVHIVRAVPALVACRAPDVEVLFVQP